METYQQVEDGILREERIITIPHPDIELGVERKQLEYFLTFPKEGLNKDTGLVFCIPPWGDKADSPYQKNKLRPYISDRYNCVSCGINYFGIQPQVFGDYVVMPSPHFFEGISVLYDINPLNYADNGYVSLNQVAEILRMKGIKRLPSYCRVYFKLANGEYESFGFLPALDHLTICGEILKRFPLNTKRIIAFGSSYGGYIALLMAKYAPQTFSVIIDNSGFVRTSMNNVAGVDLFYIEKTLELNGVSFPWAKDNLWRIYDEMSPYYFSDSHKCIRNLLQKTHNHCISKYYIFHAEEDPIAPTAYKKAFVDTIKNYAESVYSKFISKEDLDGKLFKTLEHGMNASLRGIFDYVYQLDGCDLAKRNLETDFDLESTYEFHCKGITYSFNYHRDFTVDVSIKDSE